MSKGSQRGRFVASLSSVGDCGRLHASRDGPDPLPGQDRHRGDWPDWQDRHQRYAGQGLPAGRQADPRHDPRSLGYPLPRRHPNTGTLPPAGPSPRAVGEGAETRAAQIPTPQRVFRRLFKFIRGQIKQLVDLRALATRALAPRGEAKPMILAPCSSIAGVYRACIRMHSHDTSWIHPDSLKEFACAREYSLRSAPGDGTSPAYSLL